MNDCPLGRSGHSSLPAFESPFQLCQAGNSKRTAKSRTNLNCLRISSDATEVHDKVEIVDRHSGQTRACIGEFASDTRIRLAVEQSAGVRNWTLWSISRPQMKRIHIYHVRSYLSSKNAPRPRGSDGHVHDPSSQGAVAGRGPEGFGDFLA